jgi:ubiquinone/menaquinone biosynthesis C-methylase UbiE
MSTVKEHYDALLSKVYSWMLGNFDERMQQQRQFFEQAGLTPSQNGVAIDVGCGNGIQTMALTNLGFKVTAVDFNRTLLDELRQHAQDKPVQIVEASATDVQQYAQPAELISCMGDTLTHFDNIEQVAQLFAAWRELLLPGGRLVLSFRELDTPLEGGQRFIPVRSDDDRILTCFLEFYGDHVMIHDLLHEKADGRWNLSVSAYKKLRLSRNQVTGILVKSGFDVTDGRTIEGMLYLVARKSPA